MKPFLILLSLIVVGALAAPFFLTLDGKPLMSVDEALEDATPSSLKKKTDIYRWQDEQGVWQFGEEPPTSGNSAQSIQLEDKITSLGRDWHGGARQATTNQEPTMPIPGVGGLLQGKELMDAASSQALNINARTEHLDSALKDIQGRQ